MKVTIRKWNAVATWRWDIPEDDVCVSGKCGHNFHMHCIVEWIKQDSSKGQCPMCRQKFEWTETIATDEQEEETNTATA
ncbi:hypothetical protein V501_02071 [Pseudogymnoascus sp. VKM F-4519 (FW-2642)]|nr:hypothetical protein V501_02071 [Pseudogymnoascus sp. VKM F-4519 (FW-2642)]